MSRNEEPVKALDEHVETASLSDKRNVAVIDSGDYSGASKKTDPAEIALVRKLDIRIMVYTNLNTNFQSLMRRTANPMGDVLPQLPRSQRLAASSP